MKNSKLKIKKGGARVLASLVFLHFAFCIFNCSAITPWTLKIGTATNAFGSQQMGAQLLTPANQLDTPFTVNGTNLIFGGNTISNFTFTSDSSGYFSNVLYAGTYKFILTNYNAAFIAQIPDTTNVQSLTLYITNMPVFSGVALDSYGLITNLLHFPPATNSTAGITAALGYTPPTNSYNGLTNSLGFPPATNSNSGITSALGYTPPTNSYNGLTNALTFPPATNTTAGIEAALGYVPPTNNYNGLTNSLGFDPAHAANTNDFARNTLAGITAAQGYTSKTNDGYIGLPIATGWIATNGPVKWVFYNTNNLPGNAFTNLGAGSLMTTSNGAQFCLSNNLTWIQK
jgi:hypothetical protein